MFRTINLIIKIQLISTSFSDVVNIEMSLFWIYRGIIISHQKSINTNSGLKQFEISHYEFSKAGTSNEIFKRLVD